MTQKKKAKAAKSAKSVKSKKPAVLEDPKVKRGLAMLKKTEDIWDEKDLKAEISKVKKQQERLNKLLTDLGEIEHGTTKKAKKK